MHHGTVSCCTNLRTRGAINNTAGKAIGHAMEKPNIQLAIKLVKPSKIAVNTPDMMKAILSDIKKENNKLVCLG